MAALKKAKMSDVVNGAVSTVNSQTRLARRWKRRTFFKKRVKDNPGSGICLTPHTEETREPFTQAVCLRLICLDGQANCRGGTRVGGAAHAAAKSFPQSTCDQRQF